LGWLVLGFLWVSPVADFETSIGFYEDSGRLMIVDVYDFLPVLYDVGRFWWRQFSFALVSFLVLGLNPSWLPYFPILHEQLLILHKIYLLLKNCKIYISSCHGLRISSSMHL
jgi:hypothetical protein